MTEGGEFASMLALGAGLLGATLGPIGQAWGRRIEAKIAGGGPHRRNCLSALPTWRHARSVWRNWKSASTSRSGCWHSSAALINCRREEQGA